MKDFKSIGLWLFLVSLTGFFFNACKDSETKIESITSINVPFSSSDTLEEINGVKWSTRNVDSTGIFTSTPEESGRFYQWNCTIAWPSSVQGDTITVGDSTVEWNSSWTGGYSSPSSTDTWTTANDPSPSGWRVPTLAELKTLLDTTKVAHAWILQNNTYGIRFTDKSSGNAIFFPASGFRNYSDGIIGHAGSYGGYWASTTGDSCLAYSMYFTSNYSTTGLSYRPNGFTIRPVAK